MKMRLGIGSWIALMTVAGARPTLAQRHSGIILGAGGAVPFGAFDSEVNVGWHLSGAWDLPLGGGATSMRIELAYVRFSSSTPGQNPRMIPLLLGLAVTAPTGGAQVYVVGGSGLYYFKEASPTFDDNKFGLNGGVGVAWLPLSLEARVHSVFDRGDTYVTFTGGVRL